jgi:hypothetical protein
LRHGDGLPVQRRQRGCLIGDIHLGGEELLPTNDDSEAQERAVDKADDRQKRRQDRVVLWARVTRNDVACQPNADHRCQHRANDNDD